MSKRFKLKLFRAMIPSFRLCRSKRDSSFPQSRVRFCYGYKTSPVNRKARDLAYPVNYFPPPNTPYDTTPMHTFVKSGEDFKCGTSDSIIRRLLADDYTWSEEPKWLTVGKAENCEDRLCRQMICPVSSGDIDDDGFSGNRKNLKKKKRSNKNKKRTGRTSTAPFTDEEAETFQSSRSFSNKTVNESEKKQLGKLKRWSSYEKVTATKNVKPQPPTSKPKSMSPLRAAVLGRMTMMKCGVEGKAKESFAVVKKSEDPYEDFKTSMLEMISEKQMFDAKDLEELLRCFLTLNSREHHGVIVEAFTEIWEILFL